jgi:hypothetical protein
MPYAGSEIMKAISFSPDGLEWSRVTWETSVTGNRDTRWQETGSLESYPVISICMGLLQELPLCEAKSFLGFSVPEAGSPHQTVMASLSLMQCLLLCPHWLLPIDLPSFISFPFTPFSFLSLPSLKT